MITLNFDFRLISKDNEKIANRQGRYFLSSKFKKFDKRVRFYAINQYQELPLRGDLRVTLVARFTNRVHSDCTNLPKGCLDALQKIVYNNDNQIKDFRCIVVEGEATDSFTITIERINGD